MTDHRTTGQKGEEIAMRYLMIRGYIYFGKNVRIGHDEIDLILYDHSEDAIVFVEVKTRSKDDPDFHPLLNFTTHKKQCVQRAAKAWIARQTKEWGYRIDLVTVVDGQVRDHVKNVQ